MPLALLALAIGAFGIGTTEFVIMGLLPEVASDYGVSIPTAGYLVTGYALGVMLGAPLMTVLGTKVPRKRMLVLLMGLFIVGNLVSALAPAFSVMLIGRVIASLAHGAFFGIGSVVAAGLVAPHKKAGAIAMMFTGLTVANVVGVPLGTLIGQSAGWRVTLALVAALGVVGLAGVAKLVPDCPGPTAWLRHEMAAFKNVQVLLAIGHDRPRLRRGLRGHHLHRADDDPCRRLRRWLGHLAAGPLRPRHGRRQPRRRPVRRPCPDAHAVHLPGRALRRPRPLHLHRARQDRVRRDRRPDRGPGLRHRSSAAKARPGPRPRRSDAGLRGEHRCLQPGQRALRLARRRRHRRGLRLHRTQLGRRRTRCGCAGPRRPLGRPGTARECSGTVVADSVPAEERAAALHH
ncbi:sugar efflux transporter [Streptomyces tendae]